MFKRRLQHLRIKPLLAALKASMIHKNPSFPVRASTRLLLCLRAAAKERSSRTLQGLMSLEDIPPPLYRDNNDSSSSSSLPPTHHLPPSSRFDTEQRGPRSDFAATCKYTPGCRGPELQEEKHLQLTKAHGFSPAREKKKKKYICSGMHF